ncbi:MAG: HipA domain-containing protein, partial [Alcanivorax sp.]|nr:HipA domain-containing protein [Alcanivorax sp.]
SPQVFTKVGDLLREHSVQPAKDLRALANWQVFNALTGNADGHLKNLSLLAVDGGWQLAPYYDLVCTLAIPRVSHRLALPVGTLDDPQNLHNNHWEAFAGQLAVSPRLRKNLVQQQAGRLHDEVDNWLNDFRDQYGQLPALEGVQKVVTRQTRKALRDWT